MTSSGEEEEYEEEHQPEAEKNLAVQTDSTPLDNLKLFCGEENT